MINVTTEIKGDKLHITVDLKQRHGLSSTGKTLRIASTEGNVKLPDQHSDVQFGLNVFTKNRETK